MLPVSSTLSVSLSSCLPFSLFLFLLFPFPVDSKAVLHLQIKVYLCLQLSPVLCLDDAHKQKAHNKYINNTFLLFICLGFVAFIY